MKLSPPVKKKQKKTDEKNPPLLNEADLQDKNIKIRISTMIDLDVLKKLKEEASKRNKKYQTYLNEILRDTLMSEESIQKTLYDFDCRIKKLEKKSA